MLAGALAPYEDALGSARPLGLRTRDGRTVCLDVGRWLAPADAADETVLQRCTGPVLDVGCGPGRLVASLVHRGVAALGVDVAAAAIGITRRRGLPTLHRDVFGEIPGEGRWPTVLLIDGNIGIGGDPVGLLDRVRALLAEGGRLIAECDPDPAVDERLTVRFTGTGGRAVGPEFGWALVGGHALVRHATRVGYTPSESWTSGGRSFVSVVG